MELLPCLRIKTFIIIVLLAQAGAKYLSISAITPNRQFLNNFQNNGEAIPQIGETIASPYIRENLSSKLTVLKKTRQLPPRVVGGAIGGGLGGGIGGAIGGGVGYLVAGPIGDDHYFDDLGGIGGAAGGGTGGLIGGKIGCCSGAAIGAGVGGAIGGGIGGFLAGPFGGGLGGLLGGGTGGGFGAAYIPDRVTHEEDVPGFPKRNITIPVTPPDDDDSTDKLPHETKSNFSERVRQRISALQSRFSNIIKNGK